jgi:mannose-6-phosphate isomerase-like protein (cupin superfamily)
MAKVIDRTDWADHPALWKGEWEGATAGAAISVIFNRQTEPGGGPRLHSHPYAETFIIRSGEAVFTVGGETIRARAGQIVVVPAGVPHKFTNPGPEPLESIDIHESGRFITEWLE